ncbi:unnamed protein product, partial [Adineta steineri]
MPTWSKGCLRPHSPLRPNPTTILGTNSPNLSANNNIGDNTSVNPTEGGSNRTLKRFMTMKKSKANEFLK